LATTRNHVRDEAGNAFSPLRSRYPGVGRMHMAFRFSQRPLAQGVFTRGEYVRSRNYRILPGLSRVVSNSRQRRGGRWVRFVLHVAGVTDRVVDRLSLSQGLVHCTEQTGSCVSACQQVCRVRRRWYCRRLRTGSKTDDEPLVTTTRTVLTRHQRTRRLLHSNSAGRPRVRSRDVHHTAGLIGIVAVWQIRERRRRHPARRRPARHPT
jgi:hypothetical protein